MPSSPANKLFPEQKGFPTPNAPPEDSGCRSFILPSSEEYFAILMGALESLRYERNWYQNGDLTPAEAALAWSDLLEAAYDNAEAGCGETCDFPAPWWDIGSDADDEAPEDEQVWYGGVTDPEAAPAEMTFVQNLFVLTFSGFLVYAGSVGAAIAFHTVAPRFILAWERGDVGEIWRIIVNAAEQRVVDTSSSSPGDVVTQAVQPAASGSGYDVLLVRTA